MALPKTVQKQAEEAERIEQQMASAQEQAAQGAEEGSDEPSTAQGESVEPPLEAEGSGEQAAPAPNKDQGGESDDDLTWEQRYKSYKGHFDAELRRMTEAVRDAESRAAQREAEVRQLNERLQALESAQQTQQEQSSEPLVTSQDEEAFGEDLVDLQRRVARQVLDENNAQWREREQQLLDQINQLSGKMDNVQQRVHQTDEERFYAQLGERVSNWQQVNQDPQFLSWLEQVDPMYGKPRQALLDDAAQHLDVDRVAAVFEAYQGRQQAQQQEQKRQQTQSELERQTAPNRAKAQDSGASQASGNQKVWSQQEIQKFYDDVIHGRVSGEEQARVEGEINAAVSEGRVR